jgi:hypothetical protein
VLILQAGFAIALHYIKGKQAIEITEFSKYKELLTLTAM